MTTLDTLTLWAAAFFVVFYIGRRLLKRTQNIVLNGVDMNESPPKVDKKMIRITRYELGLFVFGVACVGFLFWPLHREHGLIFSWAVTIAGGWCLAKIVGRMLDMLDE